MGRGAGLLIGKEESQKYRLVASDVCMKVKGNFCEVVSAEFFLETQIINVAYAVFFV